MSISNTPPVPPPKKNTPSNCSVHMTSYNLSIFQRLSSHDILPSLYSLYKIELPLHGDKL